MGKGGGGGLSSTISEKQYFLFFLGDFGPNSRVEIMAFGWG